MPGIQKPSCHLEYKLRASLEFPQLCLSHSHPADRQILSAPPSKSSLSLTTPQGLSRGLKEVRVSRVGTDGKSIPGIGNSICEDPEVRA